MANKKQLNKASMSEDDKTVKWCDYFGKHFFSFLHS